MASRSLAQALGALALGVIAVASCGVTEPTTTSSPSFSVLPSATAEVTSPSADPSPASSAPVMVPASAQRAADFLDPRLGPALITGSMPPAAEYYGDALGWCSEPGSGCDHPAAPPLTRDVLKTADETWAVAMYSQAGSGMGPGSTGAGGDLGPGGIYLINARGEAYFVAAGDPAQGPLEPVWRLAWSPGRDAAIMAGPTTNAYIGGGFTLIDLLTGATTTVFPTCDPVQAQARDDGWLVRATCLGESVVAVVDDGGALVTTEGLMVADSGEAVAVGDNYLVFVGGASGTPSHFYSMVDGAATLVPGEYCEHTDLGRSVLCADGGQVIVTTFTREGVTNAEAGISVITPYDVQMCTVADRVIRQQSVADPEYRTAMTIEPAAIPVNPDGAFGTRFGFRCAAAGGGIGYLTGGGGIWALDTRTGKTVPILLAPTDEYPVTEDWPQEGMREVLAVATVGGSSFVTLHG